MSKRQIAALVGVPLLLGGSLFSTGFAKSSSQAPPVTITWFLTVSSAQNTWERAMVSAFEKKYPNIRVNLETVPYNQFDSKLSAMFASGNPPDVWTDFGSSGIGTYYGRGMLLNLSPLMKKYKFSTKGIPAKLLSYSNFGGQQYGIPFDSLGSYIFYNKTLFRKNHLKLPPFSWNDKSWNLQALIRDAKAITRNGTDPAKAVYGILGAQDLYGMSAMYLWGGTPFNRSKGYATRVNFTTPAGINTYKMWLDMMYKWHVMPPYTYQQTYGNGNAPALFTVNRLGMLWTGGWELASLTGAHSVNWGIAPVPWIKTDTAPTFTDPWMIAKETRHPGSAFRFVEFLTGRFAMQAYMRDTGYSPANRNYVPYWTNLFKAYVSPKDLVTVFNGAIDHGQETFSNELAGFATIYTEIGNEITPLLNNQQPLNAALNYLESTINKSLAQTKATHGS